MFLIQRIAEPPVDIDEDDDEIAVEHGDVRQGVDRMAYGPALVDYLTAIDADFWWGFTPRTALAFGTRDEAETVFAAYRRNDGDHSSFIRIVTPCPAPTSSARHGGHDEDR